MAASSLTIYGACGLAASVAGLLKATRSARCCGPFWPQRREWQGDVPSITDRGARDSLKRRLAIVASHPIQYYVPLYRALAREPALDVHVLFASRIGVEATLDVQMGVKMAWAMDMLGGYSHEFLPEAARIRWTGFFEINNPSVGGVLTAFRPDAVIIHGYGMLTMLRALFWCWVHRVPAIMTSDSSTHSSGPGLRRRVKLLTLPWLLRRFSAFLTMSDRSESYLGAIGVPRGKMFRAPTMIDEGFWEARERRGATRSRMRAELKLAPDDMALLYVGKLYPGKRVADILEAMARLERARPGDKRLKLLVVGDGSQRLELEGIAAKGKLRVCFLGFVNIDRLPDFYCAADVLVHGAELEQFGMVILEAAILGLPMVLSDRVGAIGATSIARPGENALVYPCGDITALELALARMIDELDLRCAMTQASLRISQDHRGAQTIAGTLSALDASLGAVKPGIGG